MLSTTATTNNPNSAYPILCHLRLCVPLHEMVNPANPDSTERKSTVVAANLFTSFNHVAEIKLQTDSSRCDAQPPEIYKTPRTMEYPTNSFTVLCRVVANRLSSNDITRDTNHPPSSRAKPRASKMESTYIPILQCLAIVFGFGSILERNGVLTFAIIAIFLTTQFSLAVVYGNLSTEISHLISSTVNFTLPNLDSLITITYGN